jgi:pimeloyl-ACP methyl ester carboxylesterase
MQFTSEAVSDGVRQRAFLVGDITGVIWSPDGTGGAANTGTQPLILIGHGGGQHKQAPGIVARARRFTSNCGFAVAAIDAPGHGDRPRSEHDERSTAAIREKMESGEPAGPLIAAYNAYLTKQAVPEWRTVLDGSRSFYRRRFCRSW